MLKTLALVLVLFLLSGCEGKSIDESQIQERQGIFYEVNSDAPYTGEVTGFHLNGQKKFEGRFVDGKENGVQTLWRDNGKKAKEFNYVNGKKQGLETEWYENGQKKFEFNLVDGKLHGLAKWWIEGLPGPVQCHRYGKLVKDWKEGQPCP